MAKVQDALFSSVAVRMLAKVAITKKVGHFQRGVLFDDAMEQQIINDLKDTRIKTPRSDAFRWRSTSSAQRRNIIAPFVQRVKRECPDKDIWVWTGYKLDELDEQQRAMLPYIDVLIDGKFIQEQADPSLVWRGSANQIIHRFKL